MAGAADFTVVLDAKLKDGALDAIRRQINNLQDEYNIDIRANTNDLTKDVKAAKRQLRSLDNMDIDFGESLLGDMSRINNSLRLLRYSIDDIRHAIGSIDDGNGMNSILASINKVGAALDDVAMQFKSLSSMMDGANFNFNIDFGLGKNNPISNNAAYSRKVQQETLPQLRRQVQDLVDFYNKNINKTGNKSLDAEALLGMVGGTSLNDGDFWGELDRIQTGIGSKSKSEQMSAYKAYIDWFKNAAEIKGIDLSPVTSQWSKSADEMINDAVRIQDGTAQMEENFSKLKSIFGGGLGEIDLSGIISQLDSISQKLDGIGKNTDFSNIISSLDGVANKLEEVAVAMDKAFSSGKINVSGISSTLEQTENAAQELVTQANAADKALDSISGSGINNVASSFDNAASSAKEFADNAERANKSINASGAFASGKTYDEFRRVDTGETIYSRNAVDGSSPINSVIEAESRLDEWSRYIGNTPDLAGTPENVKTLFTKLTNLDEQTAKLNKSSSDLDVATARKHYGELSTQFIDVWGKYKEDIINQDIELLKRKGELGGKIEAGTATDSEKSEYNKIDAKRAELEQKNQQLETHLQNVLKESQRRLERYDAKTKDKINNAYKSRSIDATMKPIENDFKNLVHPTKDAINAINELAVAKAKLDSHMTVDADGNRILNTDNIREAADAWDEYVIAAEKAKNVLKAAKIDDRNIVSAESSKIKQVDDDLDALIKKQRELSKAKLYLAGLDEMDADFQRATAEASRLENEVDQLKSSLGGVSFSKMNQGNLNDVQFEKYKSVMTEIGDVSEQTANKVAQAQKKIAQNISFDMGKSGKITADFDRLDNEFSKIVYKSDAARNALEQHAHSYANLKNAVMDYQSISDKNSDEAKAKAREIIALNDDVARSYQEVSNAIRQNKYSSSNREFIDQRESMILSMDEWRKNNSKVMRGHSREAQELAHNFVQLRQRIEECDNAADFKKLKGEFADLKKQVKIEDLDGLSTVDKLKNKFTEYASYAVASMGIMEAVQGLRYMAQEVLEVDTAMTGLLRVTEMTNNEAGMMFDKMVVSAKEYGRTLTDTINATADWVRAGFDEDTALGLAEVTAMYQNVSDLDYAEASENLLTSYKGFEQYFAEGFGNDAVAIGTHIIDVLNELDNQFSVTSAGLGEGLARSASALQIAENTFEESAA